ncbi:hypothetical protein HMPREF9554_00458 [Treponema phagedenis F0421]|nr:hypothetical protein HMPREF9554_00458 [Treponema phagedenis F0421]
MVVKKTSHVGTHPKRGISPYVKKIPLAYDYPLYFIPTAICCGHSNIGKQTVNDNFFLKPSEKTSFGVLHVFKPCRTLIFYRQFFPAFYFPLTSGRSVIVTLCMQLINEKGCVVAAEKPEFKKC